MIKKLSVRWTGEEKQDSEGHVRSFFNKAKLKNLHTDLCIDYRSPTNTTFPVSRRVYTELQIYLYENGPEGRQNAGSDSILQNRKENGKSVRKWLRKINSIKEGTVACYRGKVSGQPFFCTGFFLACLLKKSHRTLCFHMLLKVQIQIFYLGKHFYLGTWMYLKNEQNTFQCTLLTVSLLYNTSACGFQVSLSSSVRNLHSWDTNTDNFIKS